MTQLTLQLTSTGKTYIVDSSRPLEHGVYGSTFGGFLTGLANSTNGTVPFTTTSVANGGTVSLSSSVPVNVLRTTSDGTIAGAVINLPTVGPSGSGPLVDGQFVSLSTTGAITAVTGTIETGSVLPVVSALTAGQIVRLRYNLAATTWFHV